MNTKEQIKEIEDKLKVFEPKGDYTQKFFNNLDSVMEKDLKNKENILQVICYLLGKLKILKEIK